MDGTTRAPSTAERLDTALDAGLVSADPELRPLVQTAALVSASLPPIPAGDAFEERLAARLRGASAIGSRRVTAVAGSLLELSRLQLRHPSRLLLTGAVSSAALGVGVTAFAVWRGRATRGASARLGGRR